jgi:hypothetical protein
MKFVPYLIAVGLLAITSPAAAITPPVLHCGELKEATFGTKASLQFFNGKSASGGSVHVLYCDTQQRCKSTFQVKVEDFDSIQWVAPLRLAVRIHALSLTQRSLIFDFSPLGADKAFSTAIVDSSMISEPGNETLQLFKDKCAASASVASKR